MLYFILALFFRILFDTALDADWYMFCKACNAISSGDMPLSPPVSKVICWLATLKTGILYHLTEGGLWNIKTFHAVIVIDREVDLYELVAYKNACDACLDTLLTEACNYTIEV